MEEMNLQASRRELLGKRVRALRRKGLLPAHLYGPHTASIPLQLDAHTFQRVWARAGSLSLISLQVDGEQRTVLIRDVQREPTTGNLLHADLYAVAMTERLRASVPVVLHGEAPAARQGGVLLRALDTIEVESLPRDLPHQLDVDVSGLAELEAGIHVRDLTPPPGVTMLTPGEELVVKVATPRVEVEEVVAPTPPPAEAEVGRVESAGEEAEAED